MPSRRRGAGRRDPRHAGLGIRTPTVSLLVTPQQVVEDARDTVFTILDGASLEDLATGIVEGARDELYTLLTGAIAEI